MQCYYSTTAAAACLLAYCTLLSCQWIQWSAFSAVLLTHNMRQIDLYANCTPYLTPLHMLNAFSFLPTHTKYSTLYTLLWLAKKAITKNIRLKKHTKDTQTQTFYILCFTIQSFQLNSRLINGFFFVFFFSSRFSCEYCIFVATVLWYRLVAKPYNSTCCSIEKRTAQLNSTLLSENGGIHVKGAACVVLLQQTQKN